ncbi:MAG: GtrA family protein [Novosphingobium sp.]|uniref:GtrA family protein n=1 Tax=Novosphingobium sp. TaxID=1874826 RepID=UPI003C7E7344
MTAWAAERHSIRYVAVAGLSAVVSNAILIGGDAAGIGYMALVLVSWLVTGTLAYLAHAFFTFRQPILAGSWLRFLVGAATGIPAAWLLILLFGKVMAWPMVLAAPAATLVMFGYHYINARLAILRRFTLFSPTQ